MQHYFKSAVMVVVTLFMIFPATMSHAKLASPPIQLTSIFMDFAEFEAAFKNGNWNDAKENTGKISDKFNQMLPQLKREIKGDQEKIFQGIMGKLNHSVTIQDKEKTQKLFIELHKFVLTLISNYAYKTPPIFIVINKYIGETEEALENKRYDRVLSEVEEISFLFSFAESHFDNRDTRRKQIGEIISKLREIKVAAQNKNNESVKTGIISLKKMLSALVRHI
ncbi:MAG: hypothetical protein PHY09_14165 [Desulfuromonadaceae bacterium]|nr:hypothetical protein [Desulfuromonadaceae bacterium]